MADATINLTPPDFPVNIPETNSAFKLKDTILKGYAEFRKAQGAADARTYAKDTLNYTGDQLEFFVAFSQFMAHSKEAPEATPKALAEFLIQRDTAMKSTQNYSPTAAKLGEVFSSKPKPSDKQRSDLRLQAPTGYKPAVFLDTDNNPETLEHTLFGSSSYLVDPEYAMDDNQAHFDNQISGISSFDDIQDIVFDSIHLGTEPSKADLSKIQGFFKGKGKPAEETDVKRFLAHARELVYESRSKLIDPNAPATLSTGLALIPGQSYKKFTEMNLGEDSIDGDKFEAAKLGILKKSIANNKVIANLPTSLKVLSDTNSEINSALRSTIKAYSPQNAEHNKALETINDLACKIKRGDEERLVGPLIIQAFNSDNPLLAEFNDLVEAKDHQTRSRIIKLVDSMLSIDQAEYPVETKAVPAPGKIEPLSAIKLRDIPTAHNTSNWAEYLDGIVDDLPPGLKAEAHELLRTVTEFQNFDTRSYKQLDHILEQSTPDPNERTDLVRKVFTELLKQRKSLFEDPNASLNTTGLDSKLGDRLQINFQIASQLNKRSNGTSPADIKTALGITDRASLNKHNNIVEGLHYKALDKALASKDAQSLLKAINKDMPDLIPSVLRSLGNDPQKRKAVELAAIQAYTKLANGQPYTVTDPAAQADSLSNEATTNVPAYTEDKMQDMAVMSSIKEKLEKFSKAHDKKLDMAAIQKMREFFIAQGASPEVMALLNSHLTATMLNNSGNKAAAALANKEIAFKDIMSHHQITVAAQSLQRAIRNDPELAKSSPGLVEHQDGEMLTTKVKIVDLSRFEPKNAKDVKSDLFYSTFTSKAASAILSDGSLDIKKIPDDVKKFLQAVSGASLEQVNEELKGLKGLTPEQLHRMFVTEFFGFEQKVQRSRFLLDNDSLALKTRRKDLESVLKNTRVYKDATAIIPKPTDNIELALIQMSDIAEKYTEANK